MSRLSTIQRIPFSLVMSLALAAVLLTGAAMARFQPDEKDREQLWKEVTKAQNEGLPKTAIEKLKLIYADAMKSEDLPEAIRALGMQLMAEGSLEDPAAVHMIGKLQAFIPDAPERIQPILKLMLADWHFAYYQQNRWQFAQRDRTTELPGDDIQTWDLPQILSHVDQLYQEALVAAEPLKDIAIEEYDDILTSATSDTHRPTLYDFVAFQALQFYQLNEQIVRQQGAFDVTADSPIFSSTDQFLAWSPETADDDSYLLHAVGILQDLTRFHAEDDDATARLDTELARYEFGNHVAVGSEKQARYRAALQRFADQNTQHPLSSLALAKLAQSFFASGDYVQSLKLATIGSNRFPDSHGGKLCHNQRLQVLQKELSVETESTWNTASSSIEVLSRNLDEVHFRLLPFDYVNWELWGQNNEPHHMLEALRQQKLQADPVKEWSVSLNKREDYQPSHSSVDGQFADLPSGCYLLISSARPDFAINDNQITASTIWISQLSAITANDYRLPTQAVQIMDAISGVPVEGATVKIEAWVQDGRNSRSEELATLKSDENGFVRFTTPKQRNRLRLLISHDDQELGFADYPRYFGRGAGGETFQTVFFTDRSIYRPGQTIHFKGIMLRSDTETNEYHTAVNRQAQVVFWDVNGQVIENLPVTSNEYGSFSGSFTAPADRATGRMRIGVQNTKYNGNTWLAVEEYKRPKFYVELESPETQFQLEQPVTLTGKATAYTGAAIDGAKVKWRVVRNVRYPDWWMWRCWYCPPMNNQAQEIANGEATTGVDGKFAIDFVAEPDRSVDRESQPIFTYSVYADVTDTTGETRSDNHSIRLGYTSLQANLNIEQSQWLTPDSDINFNVSVTTLDGQGQAVEGQLVIRSLQQPEQVPQGPLAGLTGLRDQWLARLGQSGITPTPESVQPDLTDIRQWKKGDEIASSKLAVPATGKATHSSRLGAGAYCATLTTRDDSGNPVSSETFFLVLDPKAEKLQVKLPHLVRYEKQTVQPGETIRAFWGTGYENGRAYVRWVHRNEVIKEFWTDNTQTELTFTPSEEHRGGLQLIVTYAHENRIYVTPIRFDVPWTDKQLTVKWEHFVSKLTPGKKETWTAVISDPEGQRAAAEMVATLYDASLDAFSPHQWTRKLGSFYYDSYYLNYQYSNRSQNLSNWYSSWRSNYKSTSWQYRNFRSELVLNAFRWARGRRMRGMALGGGGFGAAEGAPVPAAAVERFSLSEDMAADGVAMEKSASLSLQSAALGDSGTPPQADVNLENVSARKNLQETAFFFPHLISDKEGVVRMEFEVPEALTQWKLMGLAHDAQLRSGYISDEAVTSKDLMVQPNPPRFLREGDSLQFSVKVSNQSPSLQSGKVRLQFENLQTGESMDSALQIENADQTFEIPAGQSQSFFWTLQVPDFVGVLSYKAVGATDRLSDGEEGFLPVLSKRILVTESLPLPIRGPGNKSFTFESLLESAGSDTIKNQTLTVQMTSNPSWYAVMALPYLMEYPHECSEQVFNRLYANALARHIVKSDDRIARVFQQWRGTDALDSPLEKNQDLRNVLIEQSPWLRDAKKESQARRNVGVLFDNNRLDTELQRALKKLAEMQLSDGAWPWFPGGRANDYITLYVTTGFGRLRHLNVDVDVAPALKSLDRLDDWIDRQYKEIVRRGDQKKNNLSPTICLYLYGRTFFLDDKAVDEKYKEAFEYFVAQGKTYWVKLNSRQPQGHLAIALHRLDDQETPKKIVASLIERSKDDEEMGMFWLTPENSWWWYQAPIETQALMIEVFDEVAGDRQRVEDLKVWLLKQKQTQNWKTTKATADAVYALLLRGTNQLASNQLVEVELDGTPVEPEKVEAGTGFFQQRFIRGEIKPEMANVQVTKRDEGVAWGSVHWQYLEDIEKIKAYEGTPLTLKKTLYRKINTPQGPAIEPVRGEVQVGDEIVVRVELRTDRDMEYVHLKDYRGSGTEPVNVMSRYKFQDGLYYYESTKDTASHFFIDYLPRGTYVFEYSVRVQHRGTYESGIAELQCMYAPEFNSHSASVTMEVR